MEAELALALERLIEQYWVDVDDTSPAIRRAEAVLDRYREQVASGAHRPAHPADFRALALELSLRTIAILHRESTAHRGFCVECNQEYPCVTNLEALTHLDGDR